MSKLETFKNNVARIRAERKDANDHREWLAAGGGVPDEVVKREFRSEGAHPIMDPPQDLINLYCMEAEVYARENLMGDSTRTRDQMRAMLHDHLMNKWHLHNAADSLGMSNRRSYWKPSTRLVNDFAIQIYLGDKLIGGLG